MIRQAVLISVFAAFLVVLGAGCDKPANPTPVGTHPAAPGAKATNMAKQSD